MISGICVFGLVGFCWSRSSWFGSWYATGVKPVGMFLG
jgi:hypothetical protein